MATGILWEQTMEVDRLFIHPDYRIKTSSDADIALIELKKKVLFNQRVRSACVVDDSVRFGSDAECWVTGWGATKHKGFSSQVILDRYSFVSPYSKPLSQLQSVPKGKNRNEYPDSVFFGQKISTSFSRLIELY